MVIQIRCPTGAMVRTIPTTISADIPKWVYKQRYSWHGVDYLYHGQIKFDDFLSGVIAKLY